MRRTRCSISYASNAYTIWLRLHAKRCKWMYNYIAYTNRRRSRAINDSRGACWSTWGVRIRTTMDVYFAGPRKTNSEFGSYSNTSTLDELGCEFGGQVEAGGVWSVFNVCFTHIAPPHQTQNHHPSALVASLSDVYRSLKRHCCATTTLH